MMWEKFKFKLAVTADKHATAMKRGARKMILHQLWLLLAGKDFSFFFPYIERTTTAACGVIGVRE